MKVKEQNYFGKTESSKNLKDFYISLTSYNPETKVANHFHGKPYLCLLVSGSYQEKSYKDSEIIKTGTTLFRPANYEHANNFSNDKGVCLNIEINNPEKYMLLNDFKISEINPQMKASIDVYKLLYFLMNGVSKDILNITCYESIFSHFDFSPIKGKLNWIYKIKEQIRENPFAIISLSKLSIEFGLHPNYIVRKFKEVTGYKLSDYLNKTRLENSLPKLVSSTKNLTSIAYDSGFYDQSHFAKNFKKYFIVSPKEFRKVIKG